MIDFGSVDNPAVVKALNALADDLQRKTGVRYEVGIDFASGSDVGVRQHADGRVDYWKDGKWSSQR